MPYIISIRPTIKMSNMDASYLGEWYYLHSFVLNLCVTYSEIPVIHAYSLNHTSHISQKEKFGTFVHVRVRK